MTLEQDKNKIERALYLVSTPIGNLKDISQRAIDILKQSDIILCEDTRVAKKLLNHYNIESNLISNHKFNEKKNVNKIIDYFKSKNTISLISDAGTPLISDPGNIIVNACIENKIKIVPIPGVSAVTAAISVSGFSNDFYFKGFLPDKLSDLENDFSQMSNIDCSFVFFVSAKKLKKYIKLIKKYFSGRKIVLCREITKYYEEFHRSEVKYLDNLDINLKGEVTIVISEKHKLKKNSEILSESDKTLIKKLINNISVKDISEIIKIKSNISKSRIYKYCLGLKNET